MELTANLHSLYVSMEGTFFFRKYPPNVYLVQGDQSVLIDSGYGDEASVNNRLKQLRTLQDPELSYVILTHPHPDHLGGAERFKDITGAKIIIHNQDADVANEMFKHTKIDDAFKDGDIINIGNDELQLIHTPGHTYGHTCVLRKSDRALFTGDHILGTGTTAVGTERGDMANYIESLRKLQGMDIATLYPGHGSPVQEPQRKIKELLDHRLERECQILNNLSEGNNTIRTIVTAIYPELDPDLLTSATGQVTVHLIKLEKEGRVKRNGEIYSIR